MRPDRVHLAMSLVLLAPTVGAAPLPPEANVLDVTRPPYNAVCDGLADDTPAIQRAASDCVAARRVVYVPAGATCRVTDSLRTQRAPTPGLGRWGGACSFQGAGADVSRVVLADNLPAFQDPAKPNAVLVTSSGLQVPAQPTDKPGGDDGQDNLISGLTIDCGRGNPGCQGIDPVFNNMGGISDVTLLGNGTSAAGIDMRRIFPGPGRIARVRISGFAHCMRFGQVQFSVTAADVECRGARVAGVDHGALGLTLLNFHHTGPAPAVLQSSGAGYLRVRDLVAEGGTSAGGAVVVKPGARYDIERVTALGYRGAFQQGLTFAASPLARRTSSPTVTLWDVPTATPPHPRPPEPYTDATPCVPQVNIADTVDDAPLIQAALNQPWCARVAIPQAPLGTVGQGVALGRGLTIPCHVRQLDFLTSFVIPTANYAVGEAMVNVHQDCPLSFEVTRAWKAGRVGAGIPAFIDHRSTRTLVVRDVIAGSRDPGVRTHPGAGTTHLDNYSGTLMASGSTVYAEQWNPEFPDVQQGNIITNATVLAEGVKTEQDKVAFWVVNSYVALRGLWAMPFGAPPVQVPIVCTNSTCLAGGVMAWQQGGGVTIDNAGPAVLVRHTCAGQDRDLRRADPGVERLVVANGFRYWVPSVESACPGQVQ